MTDKLEAWPPLPLAEWQATRDTLHMCTQIVGKIRLALSPKMNHWWEVPFYLTARGLTTSPIPYGAETFEILFDLIEHQVLIETSAGAVTVSRVVPLTLPTAALIVVGPGARVVAAPVALIVATAVADELHVAVAVKSDVVLSV